MLKARIDKKKIFQYSAILGIIFSVIIYMIVTNFIIQPGENGDRSEDTSIIMTPTKKVDELNVDIIKDEKFKNLKENTYVEKKIEDLDVGKKDPFSPPVSKIEE